MILLNAFLVLVLFSAYIDYKGTASVDYVDKADANLQEQINNKADESDVEEIKQTLIIMDSRIYDIWKDRDKK